MSATANQSQSENQDKKKNYKDTLNLPKTGFPMRANLAQNEPRSLKRWNRNKVYKQVLTRRDEAEPFVFHDGPPYANGGIHVGHLLNKVLKDIVVRTKLMSGKLCAYVPGWDCHGLPIEHKVMTELNEKGKLEKLNALDEDTRRMAIRRECQSSAEKFVKLQSRQMQRLLTLADYDDPYLTMLPRYEKEVIRVFSKLVEEGLVYRDLKPVHWSLANRTALAEAELEYQDREDTSVYVHFDAVDPAAVAKTFGVDLPADAAPSLMIWTTTPWTLPANLAVAVHERFTYALVDFDGKPAIIARDLAEKVGMAGGAKAVRVLGECTGSDLLGLEYRHPFADRTGKVVGADYVTLEDGTGLVHTAPGHGTEDYQTGLREGLEIYCPVQGDGCFDDTAPDWLRGVDVWEANGLVVDRLQKSGHLFYHHQFTHSYPHDWRSKTPVIFRATEQWFISVDRPAKSTGKSLRDMGLHSVENDITFIPGWGRNRLRGMLESRPDWCISRQRSWGLPIPAFAMPDGRAFLTAASAAAVAEAFGKRGSDAWFTETPEQLLETYDPKTDPDAPADLDLSLLTKNYDIFDVWFESGTSWAACMRRRGYETPVDLYLEGSDQHRGWFQLSLLPALGATGKPAFKSVLTHGFMVDKDGKKMSKSGGNALDVDELLSKFGADICRWWVSSLAYENDIKVDWSFFENSADSYRKMRNVLRFLISNLFDFDPKTDMIDPATFDPASLDAWLLGQAREMEDTVKAAYESYDLRKGHLALFDFVNETLSAVYCAAMKDRLYCDNPDSPRRRRCQSVMHLVLDSLLRLIAPLMPHTADEAYQELTGNKEACVHYETFASLPAVEVDKDWPEALEMRENALKILEDAKEQGIENRLDAGVVLPDPKGRLAKFQPDFADLLNTSRARFSADVESVQVQDLREEPRCDRSWLRDGTVKERSDGSSLTDRDAEAVGV